MIPYGVWFIHAMHLFGKLFNIQYHEYSYCILRNKSIQIRVRKKIKIEKECKKSFWNFAKSFEDFLLSINKEKVSFIIHKS